MKKIVVVMLAMASIIFTAHAQENRKMKPHREGDERGMMMKDLHLTTEQRAQMKTNRESLKSQMAELKKNDKITVKEYNERKAAIMKSQKAQTDKVLTQEQKNQLAQKRAAVKGKHGMHKGKKMGQPDMDRMKTQLNLSDAQVNQLKANREAQMSQSKAIRENNQLDEEAKKAQLKALKMQHKEQMKQLLTEEQQQKMQEQKKNKQGKPVTK